MESYEEFCFSSLARLQTQGKRKSSCEASGQQRALSLIQFHGRALLSPVLSDEQRREMVRYRQRATQLDAERQSLRKERLLTQVQNILDGVQVRQVPEEEEQPQTPPTHGSPKPEFPNGFILPPRCGRGVPEEEEQPQTPPTHGSPKPEFPNGFTLPPRCGRGVDVAPCGTNGGVAQEKVTPVFQNGMRGEAGEEQDEEGEEGGARMQSLLKRSRECMEREPGWLGSRGSCKTTPTATPTNVLRESLFDKENESGGGQPSPSPDHAHAHAHPGLDPSASPSPLLGLAGPYAQLPSPEPSMSPRPHRRRPRPVSAGNIFISFPVYAAEQERGALAGWGPAGTATPSNDRSPPNHPSLADSLLPPGAGERRGSHSGAGAGGEAGGPAGFRRRSQTLDSQPHPAVDRSQERVPRFMGGVPWRPPCRRSPPAPLGQSYDLESPVPALLRPQVAPARSPSPAHSPSLVKRSLGAEPRLTLDLLTTPPEQPANQTGEAQWEVHALEDMRRRLEEEHALQLSLLIAEQEKEQRHLQQELEERERRLRDQGATRASAGDLGPDWEAQRDGCPALNMAGPALSPAGPALNLAGSAPSPAGPALSPAGPALNLTGPTLSPAERSPGPVRNMGFTSALSPGAPPPAAQPPVYLWGPSWGVSKARGRQSLVLTPELQGALCRLSALARGFLTRRLLQTEKVKHLRQTVQDTQEFIRSFRSEAPLRRGGSVSAQDLSLQERVRAQLRAALFDVHDIFFEMPLQERLGLLLQDRELRMERKLREMEKAKSPRDRVTLSAATQKSLDRKKQRVVGSPGHAKRVQQKPKSPPTNRVLQPSQGQNAPVPGQLLRQGSLYRKTPEERVKHSDTLRKQHSLG
ncbi:centriolar coiled-coil protein of 110 kDa-like isoform X2 [Anguilla anguilla]|uniref:centriolar coiled-coil protein of 110 kDa-like isoform X2 n=1 Tax=Anguilla anguilla TaxID=7936 RepID=UPI0015AE1241|nr:centriolar coiled-coil protein of 110 kDa-like isoform X2 [Anguilla anguilla]